LYYTVQQAGLLQMGACLGILYFTTISKHHDLFPMINFAKYLVLLAMTILLRFT